MPESWIEQKLSTERKAAIVYETDNWLVVLSNEQLYLGRSVVFLKRECPSLQGLTLEEWDNMLAVIRKFEIAVKQEFGAEVFNWCCLMNNAFRDDPPRPFVHFHVRPRYRNPVQIGEIVFTDEFFGSHYELARIKKRNVSAELYQEIVQRLRRAFKKSG